jgi:hypothetical protein
MKILSMKLLKIIQYCFNLPKYIFNDDKFDKSTSILTLNYYKNPINNNINYNNTIQNCDNKIYLNGHLFELYSNSSYYYFIYYCYYLGIND